MNYKEPLDSVLVHGQTVNELAQIVQPICERLEGYGENP